jgi:Protein of unknown function (DUF3467)
MAEETTSSPEQNVQVALDEREMRTSFANAYRIYQTAEEVIVDFGFNMMHPNAQTAQPQMLLKISDRQILSWPTVKRLSQSLRALIQRYEQQFGEIPAQVGQPRPGNNTPR